MDIVRKPDFESFGDAETFRHLTGYACLVLGRFDNFELNPLHPHDMENLTKRIFSHFVDFYRKSGLDYKNLPETPVYARFSSKDLPINLVYHPLCRFAFYVGLYARDYLYVHNFDKLGLSQDDVEGFLFTVYKVLDDPSVPYAGSVPEGYHFKFDVPSDKCAEALKQIPRFNDAVQLLVDLMTGALTFRVFSANVGDDVSNVESFVLADNYLVMMVHLFLAIGSTIYLSVAHGRLVIK